MKASFKSFLTPSASDLAAAWISEKTIFIFDTNVLLNLYGFEEQTRVDFFATTTKLEGKIFLPFHIGLEYNLRRLSVISNEKRTFRDLSAIIARTEKKLGDDLEALKLREKFPQISELADQLRHSVKSSLDIFSESIDPWNKAQPDVRSEDKILDLINDFSAGHIGLPPADQDWLDALYAEGAERYANRIPPGFRDAGKEKESQKHQATFIHNSLKYERKYGDLIIWKQILERVSQGDIQNVFFVTDDGKDDWWSRVESGGEKIIGPHEALRSEIYRIETVNLFHMYSTSDFLDNGRKILKVEINQSSIDDAVNKQAEANAAELTVDPSQIALADIWREWATHREGISHLSPESRARAEYYRMNEEFEHLRNHASTREAMEVVRLADAELRETRAYNENWQRAAELVSQTEPWGSTSPSEAAKLLEEQSLAYEQWQRASDVLSKAADEAGLRESRNRMVELSRSRYRAKMEKIEAALRDAGIKPSKPNPTLILPEDQ